MSGCPQASGSRRARPGSRFAGCVGDPGHRRERPRGSTVGSHQDNCLAAGCGQPRALRVMADRHGLSGADGCRAGAGRAVLEGGTGAPGPGRIGGDEDPSPCLQVYGDARPPDEASRIGAGMRLLDEVTHKPHRSSRIAAWYSNRLLASTKKNLFYSWTSVDRLEWLIYEELFALLGGVGAMRSDGMRRWEGGIWSI